MTKMVDGAPAVRVEGGRLRGQMDRGVAAFLGISYAGPPFGARRMLPPDPPARWEGERGATGYGPTCPQGGQAPQNAALFPEVVILGDDCLNLNVWTPEPGGSGLPVLVWGHGGMFMHGSGSAASYRGTSFARDGVVCVTINYRLAAEGFLYLGDGTANLGLLDQIAALEWVQANIAAFGGDPAKVTVAGQSAGAMSITTLMAMPRTRGPVPPGRHPKRGCRPNPHGGYRPPGRLDAGEVNPSGDHLPVPGGRARVRCRDGQPGRNAPIPLPLAVARNLVTCGLPNRFVPVCLHGTSLSRHGRLGWQGSRWQGSATGQMTSSTLRWSLTQLSR